jgi:4-hydroxy-tetrahydrodipicolinate synthase
LQNATLSGDYAKALTLQDRLIPLHDAIFFEPGVAGAKCGLSLLGRCEDKLRSPLLPATPKTRDAIKSAMVHAGLLN